VDGYGTICGNGKYEEGTWAIEKMGNKKSENVGRHVLLYGFNDISRKLIISFHAANIVVDGVIDQRFAESPTNREINNITWIELDGEKIRTISPHKDLRLFSEDVAIVCLNNGMNHRSVARLLSSRGIERILYLPMDDFTPQNDASIIRQTYFHTLNGIFDNIGYIPKYNECEEGIIGYDKNWVMFWCPCELLFTFTEGMLEHGLEEGLKKRKQLFQKWCDVELSQYVPYINLFRLLSGDDSANIEQYLLLQREDKDERIALLEDRRNLFLLYENAIKYNLSFFTDSPTIVQFDKVKNRFHVEDGLHRAIYLIVKGYNKVPVAVKTSSYNVYKHNASRLSRYEKM